MCLPARISPYFTVYTENTLLVGLRLRRRRCNKIECKGKNGKRILSMCVRKQGQCHRTVYVTDYRSVSFKFSIKR